MLSQGASERAKLDSLSLGLKIALYILGGIVVLFVGSAVVVGTLEGLGVIESSEDGGKSSESKPRGEDRSGNGADRGGSSSRRPTTRVVRVIDGDTVDTDSLDRVRLIGVERRRTAAATARPQPASPSSGSAARWLATS